MLSRRSIAQKSALAEARKQRHANKQQMTLLDGSTIDPKRYVLAALSEGLGETKARRFLCKLGIVPPTKNQFYKAQQEISKIVEKLVQESFLDVNARLGDEVIFGLDCSWSGRRNATHAIVVFMDMATKLIFDKVVISRADVHCDLHFNGPSNLMESAGIEAKKTNICQITNILGLSMTSTLIQYQFSHRIQKPGD